MTVRIVARYTFSNSRPYSYRNWTKYTPPEVYCVEVSPQRILYDLRSGFTGPLRFSLPLPWTYVAVSLYPSSHSFYSELGLPSLLLASQHRLKSADQDLGVPPLLGLTPNGSMCHTPLRVPSVNGTKTVKKRILAGVTAAFASGGQVGYLNYLSQNPAFGYLGEAAQVRTTPARLDNSQYIREVFTPVYSYWESLEEFPPACPLAGATLKEYGFNEFLTKPQTLVK